ncbi:MAG: sigma-70 family RNA polymerase sigma factor [Anaerolineales bacterium]|nr:sigma-70 family RNA polymerase sigma factor [Anaerolineales bacterium]
MAARTNEEWIADIKAEGAQKEAALGDLRAAIISGLPYALSNYLSPDNPQFQSLAEEVTQDTLLRVLDRLDSFEGRSRFTTWVQKIAVRIALTELRRRRWRDFSLDSLVEENEEGVSFPSLMIDPAPNPDTLSQQSDMMQRIGRIINEELTEKQRQAMVATAIEGVPLEEVARRMDMNRNALYKLLHDARLRLKKRLANEGLTTEDVWAAFGGG